MEENQQNQQATARKPLRRKVVPGALGIGKVEMIFKEKPKKRNKVLAFILYSIFLGSIYFSFGWSRELLKEKQLIPSVRWAISTIDSVKLNYLTEIKTETRSFSPPASSVTIERKNDDHVMITSIQLQDLLHAQGYMHAVDRLYQMEIYRRASGGSLSEIFGNKTLYSDQFAKIMNFRYLAEQDYLHLDDSFKELLSSYVRGINDYVESESFLSLPIDFQISAGFFQVGKKPEPWSIIDSLAIARMLFYEWSPGNWEDQLMLFFAEKQIGKNHAETMMKRKEIEKDEQQRIFQHLLETLKGSNLTYYMSSLTGTTVAVGRRFSSSSSSLFATDFLSTVTVILIAMTTLTLFLRFFFPFFRIIIKGIGIPIILLQN
jgi:acyl-homoserine lactone acylase PvdQ